MHETVYERNSLEEIRGSKRVRDWKSKMKRSNLKFHGSCRAQNGREAILEDKMT